MGTPTIKKAHIPNWRVRLAVASLRNQNGAALVVALLILVLLAILVPVAMNTTNLDFGRTTAYTKSNEAFYIAEAGIEHGKSLVKATDFNKILKGDDGVLATTGDNGVLSAIGSTVNLDSLLYAQTSLNNGTYSVRVYDNDDGDNDIYADLDGMVYVSSLGTIDGSTKQIRALVRRYSPFIDIPAAVTLVDDEVEIDAEGNAFVVDGNAKRPDPNPPDYAVDDPNCEDKHAVAAGATGDNFDHGQVTGGLGDVANNQEDNFKGLGADPSFLEGDTTYDFAKLTSIADRFLQYATEIPEGEYTGPTMGTPSNPGIFHVAGDSRIAGTVTGAGILFVDGDFRIEGDFTFEGIIVIGACDACPGRIHGTGNATIYGAIFLANDTSSHSAEARFEVDGNTQIYYSCVAQEHLATVLSATFSVVTWSEVD